MKDLVDILVIGGGAGGYFSALRAKECSPSSSCIIIEAGAKPLQKLRVSGGGRCNVTHSCFDPAELVKAYPRGSRELISVFSKFQPADTIEWFEERGVGLHTEEDGRMFPLSNNSQTIIDCFESERKRLGVELSLKTKAVSMTALREGGYDVTIKRGKEESRIKTRAVILATGSAKAGYEIAKSLGHEITPLVPSLFTFEITDPRIQDLSGVSTQLASVELDVEGKKFSESGPVLITSWGLSGPAVIRLSAIAARELAASSYKAQLKVNWNHSLSSVQFEDFIVREKKENSKKYLRNSKQDFIPRRLWESFCDFVCGSELRNADLSKKQVGDLYNEISSGEYVVQGKGVFKEEFVTCGGVNLKEVDFRTMESKVCPGLFFTGEVLDIDGITGGYNFQNAWSTGFIAGSSAV